MKTFGFLARFMIWVLTLCFLFQSGHGFYVPPGFIHRYGIGDTLYMKVNSLTSINAAMPFDYYDLPFCMPLGGVRNSALNLGQLLKGDRFQNSPYRIKMNSNESDVFLCKSRPLSVDDVNILKERIDELYQVNLFLDGLPAMRYASYADISVRWMGYPVGVKIQDTYYLFNHLKFKIFVHKETSMPNGVANECMTEVNPSVGYGGYTVVGFEVAPCSYRHNISKVKTLRMYDKYPDPIDCNVNMVANEIKENEPIVFTYEVTFESSDIEWQSRWDAYLRIEGSRIHWFSIMNSIMVIAFLSGFLLVTVRKTVGCGLNQYERNDKECNTQWSEKSSGLWKLAMGGVFCAPSCPMLLCVVIGDGVQILGMAVVTMSLATLGFMSPASPGTLLSVMIMLYLFFGIAAGYVAVCLWMIVSNGNQKEWVSVSWRVSCFFPGIALLILTPLNFIFSRNNSTSTISFSLFAILILLWLGICVPLTLIGGWIAANRSHVDNLAPIDDMPMEIPANKSFSAWLFVLGAGTLPFTTLFLQLFFILSSFWLGRYYYAFGFLLIVTALLIIVSAEASIYFTYKRLCAGDWQWWWKSFFASGSAGIHAFLYFMYYLVNDLRYLNGPASAAIYIGYSLLMALAIMLGTGAVGLLSTFWFLHYVRSSAAPPKAKVGSLSENYFACDTKQCEP